MDALSDSVEAEFSPKVADAQTGSTSIASAMLVSTAVAPCFLSGKISGPKSIWFGCMNGFLCDNASVVRAGVPATVVPATIVPYYCSLVEPNELKLER